MDDSTAVLMLDSMDERRHRIAKDGEIFEVVSHMRAQPQGANELALVELEEEEAFVGMGKEAGGLDDAHRYLWHTIGIDIAPVEAIDGIGQAPRGQFLALSFEADV